jgi:hypothetical protein
LGVDEIFKAFLKSLPNLAEKELSRTWYNSLKMISAKKLYILYFLLIGTTSLSYVSFAYSPLPVENPEKSEVKGSSISGPFAFLPAPADAMEVSSTYFKDGMNISFISPEECTNALYFYYETILLDRGWELMHTEYLDLGLVKGYSKDNLSLEISFLSEGNSSSQKTCLVNLLGSSY